MARSSLFRALARTFRIAAFADREQLPSREAVERYAKAEKDRLGRREFLAGMGGLVGASLVAQSGCAGPAVDSLGSALGSASIAIVGGGIAGLACAYELKRKNLTAQIFEAGDRVGGRMWSLGGTFPGQVVERGGELIDNLHKTIIGYAREFNLTLEDVEKAPGEVFYYFNGQRYPEAQVVDEYRAFVAAMHDDLRASSGEPTADNHNAADVALDNMSLSAYLTSRGAGALLKKAIENAYLAEYGRAASEQSCLNFLLFIHADKRSRFQPWGIFSDERYHIVEGNDRVPAGLAARLPGQITLGKRLVRVRKTAAGAYELTFDGAGGATSSVFDHVVLAMPFSVLRGIDLDASLQLPAWKRTAIDQFGYGTNAKMMLGFNGPFWRALGSSGASYSDLTNHQTTWETNPSRATATSAVLTDYSSGARGAGLNPANPQLEASRFLTDLERVFPGAQAAATRNAAGEYRVHLEHWPSNPRTLGSYTCYLPGQFTTIAGNEGKRVGNLHFAGEHTNSFYEWQGFMEGGALSGLDAAAEIVADLKK